MPERLRLMTFNVWRSGGRSLDATIEAIRRSAADVVALQECNADAARAIVDALGWDGTVDPHGHAIVTPHEVADVVPPTADEWGGFGARITIGARELHVFDAHLHWDSYGPYRLREGWSVAAVLAEEVRMRMPGLRQLLAKVAPALASGAPTFLLGDFNAPSHLDYEGIDWPTSRACETAGLVDAYRTVHPAARRARPMEHDAFDANDPGITWSPIREEEIRGAFDRIDFVHFGRAPSNDLRPTHATTLDGTNSVEPWPSDHRAVVVDFALGT